MTDSPAHATHRKVISRLKRAEGHLRSVICTIEEGRPCVAIVQQLQAVERAVRKAKQTLIHDDMDHCLGAAETGDRGDLKAIARCL